MTRLDPVDGEVCSLTVEPPVSSITGTYEGTVEVVGRTRSRATSCEARPPGTLGWVKGGARFELTRDG